jgi:hypothetical protein
LTSCNAKLHQANVCQVFHLTRYAVQFYLSIKLNIR